MKIQKKSVINLFYIPAVILFLVFVIYPFIQGIRLSFTNWNGYSQTMKFVGIKNYTRLFQDANVKTALVNTLIYGVMSTVIQNILGLGYALFLNTKFKGRSIVRTIIYMPVMIAPLIMGYIMYFFFQYDGGAVNDILIALHMEPVDLLVHSGTAIRIIVLVNSLQFVGVAMVIYLAGLQNVPTMYYEAAMIDGATFWERFKHITIPLLMPAISSSTILNLIGGLKLFDLVMALTSGGPGFSTHSLSTLVTNQYFSAQSAGYASAIGIFTFLLIMIISNVVMGYFDKKEVDV
ncbi:MULTISPECIES: carbohydrate ABC transporter permease [Clostridia]|jgi:raffinose/stachyose/melibiose transport system permease protein|uniref:Glycerol-3-phosphate ABC transporter permease n=2 Tax=Lacrimispora TaxID=2719231 RepID=A0A084JHH6_9FIRM|nr:MULTISPECIES: sugar ABC transporter permease [Clostridia]MBW4846664.1 sugar ABC transporter permease [Lachnospiraceae bacterium]KEZ88410.1 glycerol-3-phosphate ABC transporter permease [Lacrimispora celerecrescens]MSS10954.1 sugar ABC transporter permease [Clostridium sp. WB02_MRS01]SEU01201.1 raffinose/stachyose/melibiose transport system permease protein [[Clostridium] sphenoides JCM 1415]SUY53235.1 binding-protein-dependent transport system inner membrane protein [Lacrimispora sphenoides